MRRSHLWLDTVQAMTHLKFTGQKWLRLHFLFEETVDDGGPRREFFVSLCKKVAIQTFLLARFILALSLCASFTTEKVPCRR